MRAVKALFAQHPTATLQASWGEYVGGAEKDGPLPVAAGFNTEARMLKQVQDLIQKAQGAGDESCAVICFEPGLQARVAEFLKANGVQVEQLGSGKRARSNKAVVVTDAKHAKGQQFDTCVLVGVGRDQVPDYAGVRASCRRRRGGRTRCGSSSWR